MNEVRTADAESNAGGVQVSLQSVYLKDCSTSRRMVRECRIIRPGNRSFSST
jgi:hypothetical protein